MPRTAALVALVFALLSSGCLSNRYSISREELVRVASLPPESRGHQVGVLQDLGNESRPNGYAAADVAVDVAISSSAIRSAARLAARSRARRDSSDDRDSPDLDGVDGAAAVAVVAVVVLSAGIVLMSGLAATEGSRYDGWVGVDPNRLLYLDYFDGRRIAMPLHRLTVDDALSVYRAAVYADEPGRFDEVGHRPLDRVGATFALDIGASGTATQGAWWPSVRIAVGGFFLQQLGAHAFFDGTFGSQDGLLLNLRYGAEVQAYPLEVDLFSLGLYATAFDNHRVQSLPSGDAVQEHAFGWGGGLAIQLAVSTRLAVTLRGGPVLVHERGGDTITGHVTVGAAVY